ncbi:MAG: molybdopterin converting factor subunit 1 [Planctomycetales bacterium]|nr:molybdopterin converting factor subunit 1 [Planctomycetales bacterium]
MIIEVKLFAVAKQLANAEAVSVELPDKATVQDIRDALSKQHAELSGITSRAMIAVDAEYVKDNSPVRQDSEIALIPPVSGG